MKENCRDCGIDHMKDNDKAEALHRILYADENLERLKPLFIRKLLEEDDSSIVYELLCNVISKTEAITRLLMDIIQE